MAEEVSLPEPRFIDAVAAGRYTGCGERFMRRLVAERRIPFYKLGYHVRFDVADLDEFMAASRVAATAA